MRSKEVEDAINNLNFIVVTDIYDNEVRIDKTKAINEYNQSLGIALDYISELEQLPNKIRDKIKELKEELKSIQDKLSKNMLFSESEFYSFSEYTKWRVEINQKIKDINAKIQVLKELEGE